MPGKWIPAPWTRYPVTASMATRECLSSAAWNHARVSSDPAVARLNGSNGPTGLVDPGRSARFAFSARLTCGFGLSLIDHRCQQRGEGTNIQE